MNGVPSDLARSVVALHGAAGVEWLNRLPSVMADCARRWSLTITAAFEPISYHYVAPAVQADGRAVVVKAGFPTRELSTEIEALRLFDGRGVVRLLDADAANGVLLLERLRPGVPLSSLTDDTQATSIAVGLMCQWWTPAPPGHPFPTVAEWAAGLDRLRARFDGGCGPFPKALVESAEALFAELIGSMTGPVLLHGDLHHGNIVSAERQPWLALDPKGVVGEPAYEAGALLRNPLPRLLHESNPRAVLARRVDQLVEELGFDRARLVGWGLAQAVLAAWWAFEDHGQGWEVWIVCATILAALE